MLPLRPRHKFTCICSWKGDKYRCLAVSSYFLDADVLCDVRIILQLHSELHNNSKLFLDKCT